MPALRPFFTFYGGKWRAAKHYPAPKYDTIVEPFAGSAGYSGRYPDSKVILVERDPAISATWRYLLRVSPGEIRALPDIRADQTVDDIGVCEEARLLIGWWCNGGSAQPCKRPSKWMRSGVCTGSFWGERVRNRIASQVERIRHWQLIEGDYADAPDVAASWFIDPPYQVAGKHYKHGADAIDFAALGAWCRTRRGQITVCENVGAEWLPFKPWRDIKNGGKHGGKSREAIWTNDRECEERAALPVLVEAIGEDSGV